MFKKIKNDFGFVDEQVTQDKFIDFIGGGLRADRLQNVYRNSYPGWIRGKKVSASEIFEINAKSADFSQEEIDAFLSLQ